MSKRRNPRWSRRPWSEEEIRYLKDNYSDVPAKDIALKLNRTVDTVRTNARKYGVFKRKVSLFSDSEISFLIQNYGSMPSKDLAEIMGRTEESIEHKAMRIGITIKKIAQWKYCIDCGKRLSRSSCHNEKVKRCLSCSIAFNADENHHNWKGGVSTLEGIIYSLLRPVWGKPIMERDNFTCQICGKRGGDKEVHHIQLLAQIRDEAMREHPELDITNPSDKKKLAIIIVSKHKLEDGITLCKPCHKSVHTEKSGELLETPNVKDEGNQQPSRSNVISFVDRKVQRLTGEDSQTDKPDTSARHAYSKAR